MPPIPVGSAPAAPPLSWEIDFSATGFPVRFTPSQQKVAAPTITQIRPAEVPHRYLTRNLVTGEGNKASLTASGKELVALLTGDFPTPTPAPAARRGK